MSEVKEKRIVESLTESIIAKYIFLFESSLVWLPVIVQIERQPSRGRDKWSYQGLSSEFIRVIGPKTNCDFK